MTPLGLLKIPQVLGAALSANVFIVIAGQLESVKSEDWRSFCLLSSCFALNLKDFFDDMKSYEVQSMEGFSLFPTVFFRVLSYMALAWAATTSPNSSDGFLALSVYFVIFINWSLVSIWRRRSLNSNSIENVERLRRRKGWIIIYGFSAIFSFLLSTSMTVTEFLLIYILLLTVFIFDFVDSESFTSSINETL